MTVGTQRVAESNPRGRHAGVWLVQPLNAEALTAASEMYDFSLRLFEGDREQATAAALRSYEQSMGRFS